MDETGEKSLKLLEGSTDNSLNFSSTDSEEQFLKNLKQQPQDWLWRRSQVQYSLNSQLYRAREWKEYNWNSSILLLGCSLAYGVGVDDTQTISHYINLRSKFPVINLGQNGAGLSFLLTNSIILKEYKVKPMAVIYLWPQRSRQTEYKSLTKTFSHGAWNLDDSWMQPLVLNDVHNRIWAEYAIRNMRVLWDCPVIEGSFYEDMAEIAGCDRFSFIDYARDLMHPGPKTNAQVAYNLYQKIPLGMR